MTQFDRDALRAMKESAGLKNLPTEFTFIMRQAIAGAGPRAYDWSDKPHRLVYDLCDEIERIASIPKSGVERSAVLEEAAKWHDDKAESLEAEASQYSPSHPQTFSSILIGVHKSSAAAIRALASPAPVEAGRSVVETLSRRNRELEETCETKDAEIIRLSRELGLAFNREEDYVNQIEDYKRRSGGLVRG